MLVLALLLLLRRLLLLVVVPQLPLLLSPLLPLLGTRSAGIKAVPLPSKCSGKKGGPPRGARAADWRPRGGPPRLCPGLSVGYYRPRL